MSGRAVGSVPTLEDVSQWLDDHHMHLDERALRIVHVVSSQLIGGGSGDRANLHNLTTPLASLATQPVTLNGRLKPAPFPQMAPTAWPFTDTVKGWPQGGTALNRLDKMAVEELDDLWAQAVVADDMHATLPVKVVCAFLPPPLWAMIWQVICWGPAETGERLRRFLMAEAVRQIPVSEARPEGGRLSRATIRQRQAAMRRLMAVLVRLNGRGWQYWDETIPSPELVAWTTKPQPIDLDEIGAREARTDRSAPPLRLVRLAFAQLFEEMAHKQRTRNGRLALLRVYRDTLLLSLLVTLGSRISEIRNIRPRDFDPGNDHHGPRILIRLSNKAPREQSWKPIPQAVADLFRGWLEYAGLDQPADRGRVIWFGRSGQRAGRQSGPATRAPRRAWSRSAKRFHLEGHRPRLLRLTRTPPPRGTAPRRRNRPQVGAISTLRKPDASPIR